VCVCVCVWLGVRLSGTAINYMAREMCGTGNGWPIKGNLDAQVSRSEKGNASELTANKEGEAR
jgi:hypothetical protein